MLLGFYTVKGVLEYCKTEFEILYESGIWPTASGDIKLVFIDLFTAIIELSLFLLFSSYSIFLTVFLLELIVEIDLSPFSKIFYFF